MKKMLILLMIFASTATLADHNDKNKKCSVKTLKGRYHYAYNGTDNSDPVKNPQKVAFASTGYEIYYGNGTGIGSYNYSDDTGLVLQGVKYSFIYTVNPDCSAESTLTEDLPPRAQLKYTTHVDPSGNSMVFLQTDPKKVVSASTEYRVGDLD